MSYVYNNEVLTLTLEEARALLSKNGKRLRFVVETIRSGSTLVSDDWTEAVTAALDLPEPVVARDEAAEISPGAEIDDSNALKGAIVAVLENESYQTPYGTYNCRFCDLNLDDMGTGEDMHSADCLIRTLRSVLAATEGQP